MLKVKLKPFPEMETERLKLRALSLSDAKNLFEIRKNKKAMHYINLPLHKNVSETRAFIGKIRKKISNNEACLWTISFKQEKKLVGTVSLHDIQPEHHRAEIGYVLNPAYWKQGIATESVNAVLRYAFEEMKLHSIAAKINPLNKRSAALLKKIGFDKEAYFKENYLCNGKFLDTEIYSLLAKNFNKRSKNLL